MQCGSMYPLPEKFANLNVLNTFKKFKFPTGFSDHTKNYIFSLIASGTGAIVFEKHFTLNRKMKGPDHFFAIEPSQFKKYVSNIHRAFLNLGSFKKEMLPDEKKYCRREGLYYRKSFKKDYKIKPTDLIKKRPAIGIRARDISEILSKKLKTNVIKNSALFLSDFNK